MKPLVLLHGWGMTAKVFDPLCARLSLRYRTCTLPLAGYGGVPVCEPYTLEALARQVARAAPERCLVIGWSLGAQVALAWARAVPQQIAKLVLIGATPCFTQRADWAHAIEDHVSREFALALACYRERTLQRFASLQAQGERHSMAVTRSLRAAAAAPSDTSVTTLQRGLDVLLESDMRGVLPFITQAVLLIHGECDSLAPPAAGVYLAGTLPHARLHMIEGAAHAPFIAHTDTVADAIEEFFG
ncbi:MAG: alpha/beta fold hydrolase [Pseudomonadota bacterium]